MNRKRYNQLRVIVLLFLAALVAVAGLRSSYFLAVVGVLAGIVFLMLARSRASMVVDEREITIQEKAGKYAYAILVPTLGIAAILLLLPSSGLISVFARGEFAYLAAVGMVFAYLTLFLIAIYAISYYLINRKYGGNGD